MKLVNGKWKKISWNTAIDEVGSKMLEIRKKSSLKHPYCQRSKKANLTLGFLRRNLKYCPQECKKTVYISLVQSTMEYGGIIWDPYRLQGNKHQ
jgi:anaerobic selenocysteine-containing dehydrogenase